MKSWKIFCLKSVPNLFFKPTVNKPKHYTKSHAILLSLDGTQTVYDLYCGTGSIGIFVSEDAKKVIGVEMVADAIADAKENAAMNNIAHAEFFCGDVINICNDDFFAMHGKPDVMITDPPRAGMHEKLVNKLLSIAAPLVVYVSCNPATQARDLALLDENTGLPKFSRWICSHIRII